MVQKVQIEKPIRNKNELNRPNLVQKVQIEKPIRNKNELNRPNLVQKVQIEKPITRPNQPDLASKVDHLDQYWLKKGMCK